MAFCSNIFNCIDTELLRFKVLYFNTVGSFATLKTYVPLFMKQLGLSPRQVGVLLGAMQITGFCLALIVGFIVDKLRIRKSCLIASSSLMMFSLSGLAFAFPRNVDDSCDDIHVKFNQSFSSFCQLYPSCTVKQFIASDRSWLYEQEEVQSSLYKLCIFLLPIEVVMISSYSLIDVFAMNVLQKETHRLPYQRSFGAVGFGCISFVASLIMSLTTTTADYCGIDVSIVNFTPMFMYLVVMILLTMPLVITFKPTEVKVNSDESTSNETWDGIKEFWKNGRNATFILAGGALVGCVYGYKMSFVFWRVDDLGGTKLLLGLSIILHGLAEFVIGIFASQLIQAVSCLKIISFGTFMYAVDCFGYAVMRNPNWTLLLQTIEGVAFICTYIVGLVYIAETTRHRCLAAVTFMFSSSYLCLGRSVGSSVGGLLVGEYGLEKVFYIVSGFTVAVATILGMTDWIYTRKKNEDEVPSQEDIAGGDQLALIGQKSGDADSEERVDYGSNES